MSVQLTESTVPVSVWFTSSYSSGGVVVDQTI